MTRDAVYEDMLPGERVRLHAAYGEALERDPGLAARARPARRGRRGRPAWRPRSLTTGTRPSTCPALPASIDAARHAMDSYASAEALRHLERALEIWTRVADATPRTGRTESRLSRRAGEAAYQSGALDRARSLLADAMAELPADADPVRRALLLERYAIVQRDSGATSEAAESLRQALGLLPAGETTRAHAKLLAALANALMRNDDMVGCAEAARNAIARGTGVRGDGRGGRRVGHARRGNGVSRNGGHRARRAAFRSAARAGHGRNRGFVHRAARLHKPLGRARVAQPARRGRAGGCRRAQAGRAGRLVSHTRLLPGRQQGRAAAPPRPLGPRPTG